MKFHEVCVWWLIHIHGTALVKGIAHLIIDSDMLAVVVLVMLMWLVSAAVVVLDGACGTCACCVCGIAVDAIGNWRYALLSKAWDRRMTAFCRCRAVFSPRHGGRLYAAFGSTSRRSRFDASPSRLRRICQARGRCSAVPSPFLLRTFRFCGHNDRLDKSCTSSPCEG